MVLDEPDQTTRVDRELQSSLTIDSSNVVKSYALIPSSHTLVLVMDYFSLNEINLAVLRFLFMTNFYFYSNI